MLKPVPQRPVWLAAVLIAGAIVAAYANTLTAPFFFDDNPGILLNPSIRNLRELGSVLVPPNLGGASTSGRPLVNLSLAINYAFGGENVVGYHVFNLGLHVLSALALFGLVRRTLALPRAGAPLLPGAARPDRELLIAAGTALLWALHPLQTETVTCVIQRTEGLLGLLFLVCLYCFVRAWAEPQRRRWPVLCWIACALGMATKEVMVAAPLLLFLYDRTFGAGTFAAAWRARGRLHLALAATWGLLAGVMLLSAQRGGTVGFGLGVAWWEYLFTQCRGIVLYLQLALWPHPLVVDYGDAVIRDLSVVWGRGLLLVGLALATLWALWRRPVAGFFGAWFFCILAPSSSVVPLVTQTIAEHRMYLPLVPLAAALVVAIVHFVPRGGAAVLLVISGALGAATFERNADYRTVETIWSDAARHLPENYRIHYSLGQNCDKDNRLEEAVGHYETALRLKPDHARSHFNLAAILGTLERLEEARSHYEAAARCDPKYVDAIVGLGTTLVRLNRSAEARTCFVRALELQPESAKNEFNLGQTCFVLGAVADSVCHYRAAIAIDAGFIDAHERLGGALAAAEQFAEAAASYREAVRLDPGRTRVWSNLGVALFQSGQPAEAVVAFEQALRSKPGDAMLEQYLGMARAEAAR